ncbi:uncharacterized protein GLRG_09461 [Colletotrichum graminicola M1.001]|uniref:Uncharacterized protein n=1 Tax=Colletotrichum graminicola (strain M1.001 / M2 / FGSC 10212) TaxID=645133 RepID=E3QTX9_COLGM|nr:uncharacterized protein GLRG_09461 [Colletotrichum graminicola M1.001]EFQ34317.1 hypothetical protein GLRG_09461 [Colletotrichum graminicola M1.001]
MRVEGAGFESVDRNVIGLSRLVGEPISRPAGLRIAVVAAVAAIVAVGVFLVVLFVVVVVVVVVVADTMAHLSNFRVAVSAPVCLCLSVSCPVEVQRGAFLFYWSSLECDASG